MKKTLRYPTRFNSLRRILPTYLMIQTNLKEMQHSSIGLNSWLKNSLEEVSLTSRMGIVRSTSRDYLIYFMISPSLRLQNLIWKSYNTGNAGKESVYGCLSLVSDIGVRTVPWKLIWTSSTRIYWQKRITVGCQITCSRGLITSLDSTLQCSSFFQNIISKLYLKDRSFQCLRKLSIQVRRRW